MTAIDSSHRNLRIEDFVADFLTIRNGRATTYEPREDSFLMLEALAELSLRGLRVLDMGTGSGILAVYCARRGADVTASDIDIEAIRALELTTDGMGISIKLVTCDLFSKIHERFEPQMEETMEQRSSVGSWANSLSTWSRTGEGCW
jgi:2-polyprenyl-3-methyl-5-hydroxy-6-metoxy-1,4-benzoquinol methylase